jgi:hypothetical protein
MDDPERFQVEAALLEKLAEAETAIENGEAGEDFSAFASRIEGKRSWRGITA